MYTSDFSTPFVSNQNSSARTEEYYRGAAEECARKLMNRSCTPPVIPILLLLYTNIKGIQLYGI